MPALTLKIWLALTGAAATIIAGVIGYQQGLFDTKPEGPETAVTEMAPTAEPSGKAARPGVVEENGAGEEKAAPEETSSDKQASAEPAVTDEAGREAETPQTAPLVPSFDIVRVEPDGSVVVAGQAEPGSSVELLHGARILGTSETGSSGDFVIVLDEPLSPGDYRIVLRATTQGGVAATSLETAILTVPDNEQGQVLALVDSPGAPSRLITVPEANKEAKVEEVAESSASGQAAPESGEATQAEQTASQNPANADNADGAALTEERPANTEAEKPAETVAQNAPDKTEAEPQNDKAAGEDVAAAETATGSSPAEEAPSESAQTQAKVTEAGGAMGAAAPFIEAVEIDGRELFVAGSGEAGRRLRIYANDILLGEAVVGTNGRFLLETLRDLPVGDYIVRADMLARDGRTVEKRAAVPFTRGEGAQVAAVAPQAGGEVASDATPQMGSDQNPATSKDVSGETSPENTEKDMASASPGETVESEKLKPVDGAVIIRRGDTLWHISRRVYGRGIRYSTIYLANQDQIRDPDLILPGQVFSVPDTTEEGEPADLDAIGDQLVPTDGAAAN